jgi:hypothetical protein
MALPPTLTDFGHASMRVTGRTAFTRRPLLVTLANFQMDRASVEQTLGQRV